MNRELNFEQLQKKLKKVLNPERFRFVVILYPNTNMIDEIKEHISSIYPESSQTSLDLKDKSYQEVAPELYKNDDGFVYINDFDEILNSPDLYNGFNQRRDKIASFNINLICFISLYQKDELFTKAINVIPDLWEFKNTVLELEKDNNTDKLSNINVSSSYSSIGGLTTEDKEAELEKLLEKLNTTGKDELNLNILYQISTIYKDIGHYKQALYYVKKQLNILNKTDNNSYELPMLYNNISLLYTKTENFEKALEYQQKALNILENNNNFLELIITYSNIAETKRIIKDYKEALYYQKKALKLEEDIIDNNNPNLAISYNNLSLIYKELGNLKEALYYQLKDITITKNILGDSHPDLAVGYNNIAALYYDMGDLYKALEYQKKDVTIKENILGSKHPDLAKSYHSIAVIYLSLKECRIAQNYFINCIKIFKNSNNLSSDYLKAKKNLKLLESQIRKQQKSGYKQKGKYCKDM